MGKLKFKNLSDKEIDYMHVVYKDSDETWDSRMHILKEFTGKSERTVLKWCSDLGFSERKEPEPEQFQKAKEKQHDKSKKRFIITWGQCNTNVHTKFLSNIETYAKYINADIHVIAGRYRNPTSLKTEKYGKNEEVWSDELLPYLDANRHDIHRFVSILADIKIQPTAARPMSSMSAVSGDNSCIFGAPKVHMEMIPVLEGREPKMMVTTGACTIANYTETKAGKKGEFHHTLGFVIVEIKDNERFYLRQVTANNNGSFNDLFFNVKDNEVTTNKSVAAIILGDVHVGDHDERILNTTFNDLFIKLRPDNVILHDVFNGHSISHHEEDDPFKLYERELDGTNSLKTEIDNLLIWLEQLAEYKVTVVRSNHDDFIDRWLKRVDWKKQFKNKLEYIEYSAALLRGDAPKGIIPYVIDRKFPQFNTLDRSSSFNILNWELGHHGDIGTSGSRGSLLQFRRLNTKCVIGHYHAPGRFDGALSVGTSTKLRLDYNKGASAWLQSHVIIHHDGKAQHINFIGSGGSYTTFKI